MKKKPVRSHFKQWKKKKSRRRRRKRKRKKNEGKKRRGERSREDNGGRRRKFCRIPGYSTYLLSVMLINLNVKSHTANIYHDQGK
jgi:hypothetical protein